MKDFEEHRKRIRYFRIFELESQKHCNIFKGHRLLPATNLIYVTFIFFYLVNGSGQVLTVNVFCRSMKPQSVQKMNVFVKSSGWVQEQLLQAVWGTEKRTPVSFCRSKSALSLGRPSHALPQNLPQHFGNRCLIVPLQESAECWYHFFALKVSIILSKLRCMWQL